eukprot:3741873-Rhodomonas_salina.3
MFLKGLADSGPGAALLTNCACTWPTGTAVGTMFGFIFVFASTASGSDSFLVSMGWSGVEVLGVLGAVRPANSERFSRAWLY